MSFATLENRAKIAQSLHLPLPAEPRQAGLAGEELLHGGLFEVALLGDELVELGEQRIHIRQRGGDGALFGAREASQLYFVKNVAT